MKAPLRFLWKHLKALFTKRAVRVRHNAGKDDFQSRYYRHHETSREDEEVFLFLLLAEELFD